MDNMNQLAQMMRISSWRIHQSLVKEPLKIEDFWPLHGDRLVNRDKMIMSKKMLEEIKKVHNLN